MHVSPRPFLTAGVAALSVGAVALAPVQPLPSASDLSPTLRSAVAVNLAAADVRIDYVEFAFNVDNLLTNLQFPGQMNTFRVQYRYFDSLKGSGIDPSGHAVDSSSYPYYQTVEAELIDFVTKYPDKSAFYEIVGQDLAKHLLQKFPQLQELDLWIDIPPFGGVSDLRHAHVVASRQSTIDPFTPWVDTIQAASDNIAGLVNTWVEMPLPIVQQVLANLGTYIGELPAIGTISGQVVANVGNAVRAPFAVDLNTLDPAHTVAYQALPTLAPDIPQGLSDFLTTPVSGLLIGLIGPVLSPVLVLGSSITSAIGALQTSDWTAAVNALINIPAAMVNAFLNGGPTIDLTSLLAPSVLPNRLDSATVTLGGLLSQGASIFNAVGLEVSVKAGPVFVPGPPIPAGPPAGIFGSLIAMTNAIAGAIAVTPPAPAASRARRAAAEAEAPSAAAAEAEPEATSAPDTEVAAPRISHRAGRAGVANGAGKADGKRSAAGRSAARSAAS